MPQSAHPSKTGKEIYVSMYGQESQRVLWTATVTWVRFPGQTKGWRKEHQCNTSE